MCGICGYVHLNNSGRPSEHILKGMMDAIIHRGPDDAGTYLDKSAALGHRRLSIIDLATGHQPISNEDGSLAIVYNGEVYNFREIREQLLAKGHVFRTASDTEVVLHAYEEYNEGCVKAFNGMFAFAIWNTKEETLFLARDRFGKKPIYYASFDNQFIFASELKSILMHPSARRILDMDALGRYLAYDYVPSPQSIFENISKLEAGHTILLKDGDIAKSRYWDLKIDPGNRMDPEEAARRILKLLEESVKRRLVSDVPLGVFLSGGIDSSAVVAMMARLMSPDRIKTFSIAFREGEFDESRDARRVADYFGTDHHEEVLDPSIMLEVFPRVIEILDEPFADSSIIPTYLVSNFTRKTVKVALGGDGGDELFMGYPSFTAHRLGGVINKNVLDLLLKFLPDSQGHMSALSYARRFSRGLGLPESVRQEAWIGSFTPDRLRQLFLSNKAPNCDIFNIYGSTDRFFKKAKGLDALSRAMYVYIKTYMADDILAKVDRASMANSLEVRAPFLDTDLAQFCANIPSGLKLKGLTSKWILKKALKGALPAETLAKPKRGFAVPVSRWLKTSLNHMLREALDRKRIEKEGIFDPVFVDRLAGDFMSGRKDVRREIWSLFMFEMWYDKWMG